MRMVCAHGVCIGDVRTLAPAYPASPRRHSCCAVLTQHTHTRAHTHVHTCTCVQERYLSLAPLYYRGAHAAAVVYDVTSPESFEKAKYWIGELQKNESSRPGGCASSVCPLCVLCALCALWWLRIVAKAGAGK